MTQCRLEAEDGVLKKNVLINLSPLKKKTCERLAEKRAEQQRHREKKKKSKNIIRQKNRIERFGLQRINGKLENTLTDLNRDCEDLTEKVFELQDIVQENNNVIRKKNAEIAALQKEKRKERSPT